MPAWGSAGDDPPAGAAHDGAGHVLADMPHERRPQAEADSVQATDPATDNNVNRMVFVMILSLSGMALDRNFPKGNVEPATRM